MIEDGGKQEREIDTVLAHASRPAMPPGAHERLMAKLPRRSGADVLTFAPRQNRMNARSSWPAVAALAASFALGIYLGAAGAGDVLWPAGADDEESVIGLGEAGDFFDGDAT